MNRWPPPAAPDKHAEGLMSKFKVERLTPSSRGINHTGCRYFVLDITHDPHALSAALAYANSCESEYPFLAADIRGMVRGVALLAKSVPTTATPSEMGSPDDETVPLWRWKLWKRVHNLRCAECRSVYHPKKEGPHA